MRRELGPTPTGAVPGSMGSNESPAVENSWHAPAARPKYGRTPEERLGWIGKPDQPQRASVADAGDADTASMYALALPASVRHSCRTAARLPLETRDGMARRSITRKRKAHLANKRHTIGL